MFIHRVQNKGGEFSRWKFQYFVENWDRDHGSADSNSLNIDLVADLDEVVFES